MEACAQCNEIETVQNRLTYSCRKCCVKCCSQSCKKRQLWEGHSSGSGDVSVRLSAGDGSDGPNQYTQLDGSDGVLAVQTTAHGDGSANGSGSSQVPPDSLAALQDTEVSQLSGLLTYQSRMFRFLLFARINVNRRHEFSTQSHHFVETVTKLSSIPKELK